MQAEVVLAYRDADGQWREVAVASRRFTVGSGAGNDLRIDAPGVSRRHVVILNHDGVVTAYECQPAHVTLLNNSPLRGSARLRGGDLLTLGDACDITVRLRPSIVAPPHPARPPHAPANALPIEHERARPTRPARRSDTAGREPSDDGGRPGPSLKQTAAVVAAILVILAVAFLLLADRRPPPPESADHNDRRPAPTPAQTRDERADARKGGSVAGQGDNGAGGGAAAGDEELEREALRVVRSLSGQRADGAVPPSPYAFPPEVVRDIRRQVEEYKRSTALRDALAVLQRDARSVAAEARAKGVPPALVLYAALALGDPRRAPSAAARAMIPQMRDLRVTFGGDDADGSLIVIAAYTQGVGTKQSHPLLDTIRRLTHGDPYTRRHIWHLRERGGLSDAAYNLVVRTIAAGLVAQDPRRYGVQAEPLVF